MTRPRADFRAANTIPGGKGRFISVTEKENLTGELLGSVMLLSDFHTLPFFKQSNSSSTEMWPSPPYKGGDQSLGRLSKNNRLPERPGCEW